MAEELVNGLLLAGDSGVGKSSLLLRFCGGPDDMFSAPNAATVGVDFKVKTVLLDGSKYRLQIWDTAGQERFRSITCAYFRGASGVIIVYDITNRKSFEDVREWVSELDRLSANNVPVAKVIVGNKSDLNAQRAVSTKEGENLAEELESRFFEASAFDKTNVEQAFLQLARDVIENRKGGAGASSHKGGHMTDSVRLNVVRPPPQQSKCCLK